jgi:GNAT superfamily N-acetyltransferase
MRLTLELDPGEAERLAIHDPMIAFNERQTGRPAGFRLLAVTIRVDDGAPQGGLYGHVLHDWIYVEYLIVPESLRGQGLGSRLMQMVEDYAREQGLAGVWLDTFEFQSRGFYEKRGYTVFGVLHDHPRGSRRYFLSKRLD